MLETKPKMVKYSVNQTKVWAFTCLIMLLNITRVTNERADWIMVIILKICFAACN